MSWLTDNNLLYMLALADSKGREGEERDDAIDWIKEWRRICLEQNCFNTPFQFQSDHARFLFYRQKLTATNYAPYETFNSTISMLSGLPGAGKSTWAKKNLSGQAIVSLDQIRKELNVCPTGNQGSVIHKATDDCRDLLRQSMDFVFDATNLTPTIRKRWIQLFHDYNSRINIYYFEPPKSIILSQNKLREERVPEDVIMKLAGKMKPPDLSECHQLIINPE